MIAYTHQQSASIQDVLDFEANELGNQDQLPDVLQAILEQAARHCAQVALSPAVAARYGNPGDIIAISLRRAPILASDGCGGIIVFAERIHC